jgi:hypothetical protein
MLKSDIPFLDSMKVVHEGFSGGFVVGVRGVELRFVKGWFKSTVMTAQHIDMGTFDGGLKVYPYQLFSSKVQFIEPFLSAAIGLNNLEVYGNYQMKPKEPLDGSGAGAGKKCCCTPGPGAPPPDPGAPGEELTEGETEHDGPELEMTEETKKLGTIKVTRVTISAGVVIHILAKRTFLDLFGEYRYGMAVKAMSTELMFSNTTATAMHQVNVGIAMGLRSSGGRR